MTIERLEKLFQHITSDFQEFTFTQAYAARLIDLVNEAIEKMQNDSIVLRFDQRSDQLITTEKLEEIASRKGLKIIRGEILKDVHGVVAESSNGRFSFDNTLEGRMERKRPELRVLASRLLFEEDNG